MCLEINSLKKQNCLFCQDLKPLRQHFGFFEDRQTGEPINWLVDRFITYTNKIGSKPFEEIMLIILNY